ncbi:MAG TPA: type IV toxin-antitoxin system AbiEi family antitoxin domain-containing protein [Acidimicrobiia bacterium]
MGEVIERILDRAKDQHFLVSRGEVLDLGATEKYVKYQVARGWWLQVHPGVYQIDRRPLSWESKLMAAVLACGPGARASHRAALMLWKMDGISTAPVEVTMPFGNLAVPSGVIVHRSRRPTHLAERSGVAVCGPERTLLECCIYLPPIVIGKALDSAIRQNITTVDRVWLMLANEGGRGVKGTKRMRHVLRERVHDTAADSGSEFELLYLMQRALLPRPELGFELYPADGRRVPDFIWPDRNKAVEVDGIDAHSSADKLDDDLQRQNQLMDLGLEIRRFSARRVRRDPKGVVEQIRQFLEV